MQHDRMMEQWMSLNVNDEITNNKHESRWVSWSVCSNFCSSVVVSVSTDFLPRTVTVSLHSGIMFHCNFVTSELLHGCQLDVETFSFCLGDHTAAASTAFVTENNIGLIIKASDGRDSELPMAYGVNNGTQPRRVNFLVHLWPSYGSLPQIAADCYAAWQAKTNVMIYCGTGLDLAPGLLAALLWQLGGTPPTRTIELLIADHTLASGYLEMDWYDPTYCPVGSSEFRSMMRHLCLVWWNEHSKKLGFVQREDHRLAEVLSTWLLPRIDSAVGDGVADSPAAGSSTRDVRTALGGNARVRSASNKIRTAWRQPLEPKGPPQRPPHELQAVGPENLSAVQAKAGTVFTAQLPVLLPKGPPPQPKHELKAGGQEQPSDVQAEADQSREMEPRLKVKAPPPKARQTMVANFPDVSEPPVAKAASPLPASAAAAMPDLPEAGASGPIMKKTGLS